MGVLQKFFAKYSDAPQPKLVFGAAIWAIALVCLFGGTRRNYGWAMIGVATVNSLRVGWSYWQYYGGRRAR
jgi:hypothetical protein